MKLSAEGFSQCHDRWWQGKANIRTMIWFILSFIFEAKSRTLSASMSETIKPRELGVGIIIDPVQDKMLAVRDIYEQMIPSNENSLVELP